MFILKWHKLCLFADISRLIYQSPGRHRYYLMCRSSMHTKTYSNRLFAPADPHALLNCRISETIRVDNPDRSSL